MSITKRMDILERDVKQLTEMITEYKRVMEVISDQNDRLLKELAASKLFEKVEYES